MFISVRSDTSSHLDQNLLHLAVTNYDKDTVEVLLKYGAKVIIVIDLLMNRWFILYVKAQQL